MTGNNINNTNEVIFNIIKFNYIQSVGYIISGFLKSGQLKKEMILISNKYNLSCQIISIHNNQIDCDNIVAPATISINVLIIGEYNKLDGSLITNHCQNELAMQSQLDLRIQHQNFPMVQGHHL